MCEKGYIVACITKEKRINEMKQTIYTFFWIIVTLVLINMYFYLESNWHYVGLLGWGIIGWIYAKAKIGATS